MVRRRLRWGTPSPARGTARPRGRQARRHGGGTCGCAAKLRVGTRFRRAIRGRRHRDAGVARRGRSRSMRVRRAVRRLPRRARRHRSREHRWWESPPLGTRAHASRARDQGGRRRRRPDRTPLRGSAERSLRPRPRRCELRQETAAGPESCPRTRPRGSKRQSVARARSWTATFIAEYRRKCTRRPSGGNQYVLVAWPLRALSGERPFEYVSGVVVRSPARPRRSAIPSCSSCPLTLP